MNTLFLCTEAFGGRGGIAAFNRSLCRALDIDTQGTQVTVLPRIAPVDSVSDIPTYVQYHDEVAGGKLSFAWKAAKHSVFTYHHGYDLVLCGHINMLPLAALIARRHGSPLWLIIHGVDAWEPHPSFIVRQILSRVDHVVSVSQHTIDRFLNWAPVDKERGHVIPNCINKERFGVGAKSPTLLDRYDLHDRTVLLTLSRLSSEEQYKGHDEVLEVLPTLVEELPDIAYLICGDGDDRTRLEQKVRTLGLESRVMFAGYVPEEEKADHYRLADAFVMPGRGEGFGIVYLEALACGVPVVASTADASMEAVLHGKLGEVVNPNQPTSIIEGIRRALNRGKGVPETLDYFSESRFVERWKTLLKEQFTVSRDKSPAHLQQ